jgi:hypothetical protein
MVARFAQHCEALSKANWFTVVLTSPGGDDMSEFFVDGMIGDRSIIYFRYGGFDGDAFVEDGVVKDAILHDGGVDFTDADEVLGKLQNWYDREENNG